MKAVKIWQAGNAQKCMAIRVLAQNSCRKIEKSTKLPLICGPDSRRSDLKLFGYDPLIKRLALVEQ